MAHTMKVQLTHSIQLETQIEFPYADLRTLSGERHNEQSLLAAQAEQDPFYAQGISELRRITDELARLPKTEAGETRRVGLLARKESIKAQLRHHLATKP